MRTNLGLHIAVFICGASVMVLELTGARLFAPFLGNSLFVWTSLIGIFLSALSVGYWWGGEMADRDPDPVILSKYVLGAAAYTAIIAPVHYPLLTKLSNSWLEHRLAAVLASVLLFAIPAVFLGMVTPFALKLSVNDMGKTGRQGGRIVTLSTLGSITGTFASGFVLAAFIGTVGTVYMVSLALIVASALIAARPLLPKLIVIVLVGLLLGFSLTMQNAIAEFGLQDLDTAQQRVFVLDTKGPRTGRPVRMFITDPLGTQSVMYLDNPSELAAPYARYYDAAMQITPSIKKVLMLGGGAYSYPRHFLDTFPEATITVVELDEGVTKIARDFFHLQDHPRLTIVHQDARAYLNQTEEKFDAVLIDVFGSAPSIPFQLTTKETVQQLARVTTDNAVIAMNIISGIDGPNGRFLRAQIRTFRTEFQSIALLTVSKPEDRETPQNLLLFAGRAGVPIVETLASHETYASKRVANLPREDMPVLEDSYAPVEWYMLPVLRALESKNSVRLDLAH